MNISVLSVQVLYKRTCHAIEIFQKKALFNFTILPPPRFFSQEDSDPVANVGMFFSDADPTLQTVSDPTRIFYSIFNINFTLVSTSCKCVRLHITTKYKLFREILFEKKNCLQF